MTVLEIMERVGTTDTELVIAYLKDAYTVVQSNAPKTHSVKKQDITKATSGTSNQYNIPADMVNLVSVSVLDTEDDDKYKGISRLAGNLIVSEDTSP